MATKAKPDTAKQDTEKKRPLRGAKFIGTVTSARMHKTATVMWERPHYIRKYERYERRRTKLHAHNPAHLDAQKGNIVLVEETRPISKTKHFVITKVIGKDIDFALREQAKDIEKEAAERDREIKTIRKELAEKLTAEKRQELKRDETTKLQPADTTPHKRSGVSSEPANNEK